MKVVVDLNRCQGYGQCVYAAPNIFQLKGPEILAYEYGRICVRFRSARLQGWTARL